MIKKKTKFYQEAFADGEKVGKEIGKLEAIPNLLKEGFNSEKIAQLLNLPLDTIKKIVACNFSKKFDLE